MNSGAGHTAPERIVAKGSLSEVLSQWLTAEPVMALEWLMLLARDMDAVFRAPRAASYEPLLIEMGYEPVAAQILSLWILTNGGRWAKNLDVSRRKLASALRGIVRRLIRAPGDGAPGRRSSSRCLMIGRGPGWRRLLPIPVCRSPLRSFEIWFEKPPKASPRPVAGSVRLRRRYFVTSRKHVEHPLRLRP